MRINIVFSASYNPGPEIDVDAVKDIGSTWGSWRSWRACSTDNVVCYDTSRARQMIERNFQNSCNFYIPKAIYQDLGRPPRVKLYDGNYVEKVVDLEDIITMHLVASMSDIVLLFGFDFATPETSDDVFKRHQIQNRHGLQRQVVASNPEIQWVLVDHLNDLDKNYKELTNLTCDKIQNVLHLLK